jgi:hypothetical protein
VRHAEVAQSPRSATASASEERGRPLVEDDRSNRSLRSELVDLVTLECGADPLCEWHIDDVPERLARIRQRQHEHTTHRAIVPPDVEASPAWRKWIEPRTYQEGVGLMGTLFVAPCSLPACAWKSDPLRSVDQAREARRTHVNGHTHAELVEFVTTGGLERIEHYEFVVQAPTS